METSEKEKYYLSYIKSAQTALSVSFILNIVYVLRFIISKNFDFYFSVYTTEFFMKLSGFFSVYESKISKLSGAVIIAFVILVFAIILIISLKNSKFLSVGLLLYLLDFAFLLWGFFKNPFSDITEGVYIDICFHILIIIFLSVGIYSNKKMKS